MFFYYFVNFFWDFLVFYVGCIINSPVELTGNSAYTQPTQLIFVIYYSIKNFLNSAKSSVKINLELKKCAACPPIDYNNEYYDSESYYDYNYETHLPTNPKRRKTELKTIVITKF